MARRQDASTGEVIDDHKPLAPVASQPTMNVKVYSPFKVYYDDETFSLTALNATGPFDILPHHHNFITLVSACTVIIRSVHGDQEIAIDGGLMHVKADKVILFLNV